jgi:hypothetical protein
MGATKKQHKNLSLRELKPQQDPTDFFLVFKDFINTKTHCRLYHIKCEILLFIHLFSYSLYHTVTIKENIYNVKKRTYKYVHVILVHFPLSYCIPL